MTNLFTEEEFGLVLNEFTEAGETLPIRDNSGRYFIIDSDDRGDYWAATMAHEDDEAMPPYLLEKAPIQWPVQVLWTLPEWRVTPAWKAFRDSMSQEDLDEAEEMAARMPLSDSVVLDALQHSIKSAYIQQASLDNGGAMAYLSAEANAIWNEAVRIMFNRWIATRQEEQS